MLLQAWVTNLSCSPLISNLCYQTFTQNKLNPVTRISSVHHGRYWLFFSFRHTVSRQRANNLWTDLDHILLWMLFGTDFDFLSTIYITHYVQPTVLLIWRKQVCGVSALLVCSNLCFCLPEQNLVGCFAHMCMCGRATLQIKSYLL